MCNLMYWYHSCGLERSWKQQWKRLQKDSHFNLDWRATSISWAMNLLIQTLSTFHLKQMVPHSVPPTMERERERGDRGMSGKHFFSQVGNGRPEGSPNIIIIIIWYIISNKSIKWTLRLSFYWMFWSTGHTQTCLGFNHVCSSRNIPGFELCEKN